MNKKTIITLFIGILLINLVFASTDFLGCSKQGKPIILSQTCSNCSYNTILQVKLPDSTTIENLSMSTKDYKNYNYTFDNTYQLGVYSVHGEGDDTFALQPNWDYTFEITPSGNCSSSSNIVFFIILIVLIYGITIVGIYTHSISVTILGGMIMMAFGVYTVSNGIIIFRDWITNYISYITGLGGFGIALWAGYEWYKDM